MGCDCINKNINNNKKIIFEQRLSDNKNKIEVKYKRLYPEQKKSLDKLYKMMRDYYIERDENYIENDKSETKWISSGNTVGMMLYVDLFSINIENLIKYSEHFEKLGITLIHLMPVLTPKVGENDGGYAVKNYRDIDSKLGNMEIFIDMIKHYHNLGIKICIDYVINHTSNDHDWAQNALMGDKYYQDFYLMFDDNSIPNKYEQNLDEIFPNVAPGNFTYNKEIDKFIMTMFYPYQWDLNYRNPEVFHEMVSNLLHLANIGIDMIRLDAIPYIWKTMGTNCRNLPEVHILLSLFRDIIEICAPSTALLGEAIVAPDMIVKYFGNEVEPECHLLYNASFMVEIWNSVATRDARHISNMTTYNFPKEGIWINYARCHDDIGWGLDENIIRKLGFDPQLHKSFLIDFYLGILKDSFSMGELYEFNPFNNDARNTGTLASLAGLEKAILLSDKYQMELAYKRILLINALFIFRKGIPMIYSGDEIGQLNDYSYKKDKNKEHDSRWLHRFAFDWSKKSPIFELIKEMITLRKKIYGGILIEGEDFIPISNIHILVIKQRILGEINPYLLIYNFSEDRQWIYTTELKRYNLHGELVEALQGKKISLEDELILMGPYEFFILKK